MMLINRLFTYGPTVALLASSIPALHGQDPQKGSKKDRETTVTGCLNKDTGEGRYIFTDTKIGKRTVVTGSSELKRHASNHTVKLTGNRITEDGTTTFAVTRIEHISGTCQAFDENLRRLLP